MLFNSLTFLVFALVFFVLWPWMARRDNTRWGFLVAASFVFYGWWDWRFLFLILFSGLVDFIAGLAMEKRPAHRKTWLWISLAANLGSLGIFKYSGWLAEVLDRWSAAMGRDLSLMDRIPEFALILPVGISFYTFQSMSYTLDIYRGRLRPTANPLLFFAYLSMFPQLVAGPIIRARDLLGQLRTHRPPDAQRVWHGFRLVVTGLFQKMVLADHMGVMVDHAFQRPDPPSSALFHWAVMLAFAFQIYFDFSGYSQIARGLAKWMGLHFKMNFNHPYLATSLRDFWGRWHISLSQWFRDYVYIPLGGNRHGAARALFHLWIAMLLSGLWHGANSTFLAWGACHALFLSLERLAGPVWFRLPGWVRHPVVMSQVLVAWVFFRAESMEQAWRVLGEMFSPCRMEPWGLDRVDSLVFLFLALVFEGAYALTRVWRPWRRLLAHPLFQSVETGVLLAACVFFRGPEQEFIYFQF